MLDAGGLVVLPTETVMGLAASAASSEGMDRLWRVMGGGDASKARREPLAWHVSDVERLLGVVGELPALHRRVIERLAPGPALFAIEMEPRKLAGIRAALGLPEGVIDNGSALLARVPSNPGAMAVLREAMRPVVVAGVPVARPEHLHYALDAWAALRSAGLSDLIGACVDAPPAPLGVPSTLIRLRRDGGFEIARRGAYEERYVRRRIERSILFVCTGNTCRSPMAAALARHLLAAGGGAADGIPTRMESAGKSGHRRKPI